MIEDGFEHENDRKAEMMKGILADPNWTQDHIDDLLERFDQTERTIQRKMIAKILTDRMVLKDAVEATLGRLNNPAINVNHLFTDVRELLELSLAITEKSGGGH